LQTPDDNRFRALVGAFYEDFAIYDNQNYSYLGIPQCDPVNLAISKAGGQDCLAAVGPVPGYYAGDPNPRVDSNTAFGEDIHRGYKQTAFFGSFDFDLIPKTLTLTVGTRHYKYDEFEEGSEYYSYSAPLLNKLTGTTNAAFGINLKRSESGYKSRANLTWHVTHDFLAYYTFSQGFRPGGFNRTDTTPDGSQVFLSAVAAYSAGGSDKQFNKPVGYDSDNLINNEVGIKSEWLNRRLQINASAYTMDWKKIQLAIFDPTHLGNTTFTINGPSYQVKGIELQFIARVTDGLTIQGSSSWNSSNQNATPCLESNVASATNPTPLGHCITQVNGKPFNNPYGAQNTSPAYSPPLQFNARMRYDWDFSGYKAFWSVGLNYSSHYHTQPDSFPDGDAPGQALNTTLLKYVIPDYKVYDGTIGLAKDNWTLQLTGNNLLNNDAITSANSAQYVKAVVPLRPRVFTLQLGYKF
jgi:iron complex outermembrane recepter protein